MKKNEIGFMKSIKIHLFLIYLSLFLMAMIILAYRLNLMNVNENFALKILYFCIFLVPAVLLVFFIRQFDTSVSLYNKSLISKVKDSNSNKKLDFLFSKKNELDKLQSVIDSTSYSKIHLTNAATFSDFSIGLGWGRSYYRQNYIHDNFLVWNFPYAKSFNNYRSFFVNRSIKYNFSSVFIAIVALDILLYFAALFYLDGVSASLITGLIVLSIPLLLIIHVYFSFEHLLIQMGYYRHNLDIMIYNRNQNYKLNFVESNKLGMTVVVSFNSAYLTSSNTIEKSLILESAEVSDVHQLVYDYFN